MSEENPARPAADSAAAHGAVPGDGEVAAGGPSAVSEAAAATNDDVEMKDASAAPAGSAEGDLAATTAETAEEPPRRTRSSSMDVREEADAPAPAPAEEQPAKKAVPEATRVSARVSSKGADRDGLGDNAMSSLLDAAEIRTTTVSGPTGMSFLDTLTEEERRTRLRHVPGAEGFKALHRSEVRRDLALARSIMTGTGGTSGVIASSKASAAKGIRRSSGLDADAPPGSRYDGMDVDDEEGGMSDTSEGEMASDSGSRRSGRDVVPTGPSPAFVRPVDTDPVPGSLPDASEPDSDKQKRTPVYPHIIESTVAFDPPRLPHSDAKSKKNRFTRWQAHPKEIEKDLETYRKTVADTRDHLHRNEHEAERVEIVGGHLRSHFLAHLRNLRDEGLALERDLGVVQAKCVEKAELTKTRSTDADGGIGAKAMHDVLTALKAKVGGSNAAAASVSGKPWCSTGYGGLPVSSEEEKNEDDNGGDVPALASGWILPGDKVMTPGGEAVVVKIDAAKVVEVPDETGNDKPKDSEEKASSPKKDEAAADPSKPTAKEADSAPKAHGFGEAPATAEGGAKNDGDAAKKPPDAEPVSSGADGTVTDGKKADGDTGKPTAVTSGESASGKDKKDEKTSKDEKKAAAPKKVELKLIPAKVTVRFNEGVNSTTDEFDLTELTLLEDPSTYSDEQLIERWKLMVESAKHVGCSADISGMENLTNGNASSRTTSIASSGGDVMEVDDSAAQQQSSEDSKANLDEYGIGYADLTKTKMSTNKVVPFGSSMLLSPGLRGTSLATIPFEKLEEYLDPMLFAGKGVLGRNDNPGVPADVKQWEDVRYELVTLKGRANQLRNELHRQRRIRMLNERTRHVLDERAERVEGLLAEMKSDLITLKERLEHELDELGMDQDHAADILAAYIKERDSAIESEQFPPAPKKRGKPEPKPAPAPRISRRNRANQGSDDNDDTGSVKGDVGGEDDSGSRRKRNRSDESVDSGGSKPKRGGYRRQ